MGDYSIIQAVFQVLVFVLLILAFLVNVRRDFEGAEKKNPSGFAGFIGTLVATAIFWILLAIAGAFDCFVRVF